MDECRDRAVRIHFHILRIELFGLVRTGVATFPFQFLFGRADPDSLGTGGSPKMVKFEYLFPPR